MEGPEPEEYFIWSELMSHQEDTENIAHTISYNKTHIKLTDGISIILIPKNLLKYYSKELTHLTKTEAVRNDRRKIK